jgi:Tol biopolymer transport system component
MPVGDVLNRPHYGEIWVVNVADGARRRIREADAVQPSWSPGGHRIAYWGLMGKGGQRDLFTVAADGTEETSPARPLTSDPAVDWDPAWSPDGQFVYFSSTRGGTMNLWRMRVDETTGEPLASPESIVTPSSWSDGITFSRDGSLLAYATLERRTTVLLGQVDPDRGVVVGSLKPVLAGSSPVRDQAVSPDGKRIAYTNIGPQEDLHLIGVDGRGHLQLTDDAYRDRGPAWSPDGRTLAFYSDRSGSYEIWLIGADGTRLRPVTAGSPNGMWYPTWSPDGRRIASQEATRLFILDATATKPAPPLQIFEEPRYWATSWGPDGDTLAGYAMPEAPGRTARLRLMSATSGTTRTLDLDGASAQWLPDGRRLLVGSRDGLVLFDTVSGRRDLLIEMRIPTPGYSVRLSPDGRHLSVLTVQTEGDVWLMRTQPAGPSAPNVR